MKTTKMKQIMSSAGLTFFALGMTAPVLMPTQAEASGVDKIVESTSDGVMMKNQTLSTTQTDENGNKYYSASGEIPSVNAKQATDWAERKGGDFVNFLQTFAYPFSLALFVISVFLVGIGAIAKNDWFKRGIFGMAISIVVFTATIFAPELLQFFSEWLAS